MILNIELPDHVGARLMDIADEREVKLRVMLSGLVGDAVASLLAEHPRKTERHTVWTEASKRPIDAEEVRELVRDGTPDVRIAEILDVSTDRVRAVRKKLGLPAQGRGGRHRNDPDRPRAEVVLDRVAELHALHRSDSEIATELGVAYAVAYRARRFQLHLPPVGKSGRKSKTSTNQENAA